MSSSRDDFGIAVRSALLQKGNRQKFSLFFLLCLSVIIFFLDTRQIGFIGSIRSLINDGVYRVSTISTSPFRLFDLTFENIKYHLQIYKENKILKKELEILKSQNLNVEFLRTQNNELKNILQTNLSSPKKEILAKVLLDKDSPFLKSVIINKGSKVGIKKGMPVLDRNFLIGRIVETNFLSSRVLLLNDLNSRIPVVLNKDSTQAILSGKGKKFPILEYLPDKYLPESGIEIFTSGKDGIFSEGVPVGKVLVNEEGIAEVKLFSDPNQVFFVKVQIFKKENK